MFYDHEILKNRSHGVATVWLVATLGSKSNLRKVTRKAILDVNVPKACETITNAENPLALRLQGSLLYGVARVYSQQCGYALADVMDVKEKMNGIKHVLRDADIDIEINKGRSDALNLPMHDAFVPDLDINFDLSAFGESLPYVVFKGSQITGHSSQSGISQSTQHSNLPDINSLNSSQAGFDDFQFGPPSAGTASQQHNQHGAGDLGILGEEESAFDANPDFEIGEDGTIRHLDPAGSAAGAQTPAGGGGSEIGHRAGTDSAISARVRDDLRAGLAQQDTDQPYLDNDDDGLMFGDDGDDGLPLSHPAAQQPPASPEDAPPQEDQEAENVEATGTTAPQRKVRNLKTLHHDDRTEMNNAALKELLDTYLTNMRRARKWKVQKRSTQLARKNAAYWILTQGVGGIGQLYENINDSHPLAVLSGQTLLQALRGPESPASETSSRKRARSQNEDDDSTDSNGRPRTRPRLADEEDDGIGQAAADDGMDFGNDDGFGGLDDNIESEAGRRAGSSIPDHPSASMPWNSVGSRQSSQQPGASAGVGGGLSSGARSGTGMQLGPYPGASRLRRPSRAPSASPLQGKGIQIHRHNPLQLRHSSQLSSGGASDFGDFGAGSYDGFDTAGGNDLDPGFELDLDPEEEFQLFGPGADVPTQTAAQSQWVNATLEQESYNFLEFIRAAILATTAAVGADGEDEHEQLNEAEADGSRITMDALLPPANNSKVVGAQALLHVLTLATKGIVEVEQEIPFGDIEIKLPVQDMLEVESQLGSDGSRGAGDDERAE